MLENDYPEPIMLPSPDEVMAERNKIIKRAMIKFESLGFSEEESAAIFGIWQM
jgi:hypothetical protein